MIVVFNKNMNSLDAYKTKMLLSLNIQSQILMVLLAAAAWVVLLAITGQQVDSFNLERTLSDFSLAEMSQTHYL